MAELIRPNSGETRIHGPIQVLELLTNDHSKNMSVAIVELNGTNDVVRNRECEVSYFVIEGSGVFKIKEGDGVQTFEVEVGDLMHIQAGTIYQNSGNMKMIAIDVPPFNPEQVERFSETLY